MIVEVALMAVTALTTPASGPLDDSRFAAFVERLAGADINDPDAIGAALDSKLLESESRKAATKEGWIDYVVADGQQLPYPILKIDYRIYWETKDDSSKPTSAKLDVFLRDDVCLRAQALMATYSKLTADEFLNAQNDDEGVVIPIAIGNRHVLVKYRPESPCVYKVFMY